MKKIGTSVALLVGLALMTGCSIGNSPDDKALTGGNAPGAEQPGAQQPGAQAPVAQPPAADPMAPAPTPPAGMAMLRAIHASPDAPAVDAYVKGNATPIVTNLAYGQTSGWIAVPQGTYEIELRAAPSKPTDPIAYKTGALAVADGAMISAVASGLLSSQDADSTFRLLPVVEKFDAVTGGKVSIRAIHAGSDAPSVGLDVGNDDPQSPEVASLDRFADTGAAGVQLPAGSLAIGVDKDGARVTAFTTPKLPAGGQLLLIATGLLGKMAREKDGFSLLAIGPNGSVGFIKQDPVVYALHASPDAPAVDAFVGTTELFDNLSFGGISKPIQVQPGEYELDFYGTTPGSMRPEGNPAATASTGQLAAGERYLATATGILGQGTFTLVGTREGFTVQDDKAVIRALHASPDAPAVDIGVVANHTLSTKLFTDLTYTNSSADPGQAADPGHLPIGVAAANSSSVVASFTVPAMAGQRAFAVAAGLLNPVLSAHKSFRFLVVDTAQPTWTVTSVFPH